MEKYVAPEMEIVLFTVNDILDESLCPTEVCANESPQIPIF